MSDLFSALKSSQSKAQKDQALPSSASISSGGSVTGFDINSPLGMKKSELLELIGEKEFVIKKMSLELNELKKEIKEIDNKLSSPTTLRPDVAKKCVYVGTKKQGKFRQLHINENGEFYYLTDSFRKTQVPKLRYQYDNAEVREAGMKSFNVL